MPKIAAIYDPYLDTLGGGERYCLTVAELLLKNGWKVDLFWSGNINLVSQASSRFSLDITKINVVPDIFLHPEKRVECVDGQEIHSLPKINSNIIKKAKAFINKINTTRKYDLFFYLSDGSIPFLFSQQNILHVQVPFVLKQPKLSYLKMNIISKIVCNSKFTSSYYSYLGSSKLSVLYPPVDVEKFQPNTKKNNTILSVGRFDNLLNAKKQDILIEAFKHLYQENKDWKLVLAGASISHEEQNNYLKHLKYLGKNLPISFFVNQPIDKLIDLYGQAKIYWHAAGYGVNQDLHPESTEHFGISVVEAMASGAVPLVVNKGGLPEIVKNDYNGYLWNTIDELVAKTQLLTVTQNELSKLSLNAIESSKLYSKNKFEKLFLNLING